MVVDVFIGFVFVFILVCIVFERFYVVFYLMIYCWKKIKIGYYKVIIMVWVILGIVFVVYILSF